MLKRPLLTIAVTLTVSGPLHAQPGNIVTTFGNNGIVTLQETCIFSGVRDMERRSDGRLMIVGGCDLEGAVLCREQDGSPVLSFGTDGQLTVDLFAGNEFIRHLHIHDDDHMTCGGGWMSTAFVIRLMADGGIDPAFNNGQPAVYSETGVVVFLRSMLVLPDNSTLIMVECDGIVKFVKFNLDGTQDLDFGINGVLSTGHDNSSWRRGAHSHGPSGSITAYFGTGTSGFTDVVLMRFDESGAPDLGFGTGGEHQLGYGSYDTPGDVLALSDGRTLICGASGGGMVGSAFVSMLNAAGAPDPSFGLNGTLTLPFVQDSVYYINKLVMQPYGGWLLLGAISSAGIGNLFWARVSNAGQLDPAFGNGGIQIIDHVGDGEWLEDGLLFDDLSLAAIGGVSEQGNPESCLVKIETGLHVGVEPVHHPCSHPLISPNPVSHGIVTLHGCGTRLRHAELASFDGRWSRELRISSVGDQNIGSLDIPDGVAAGAYRITGVTDVGVFRITLIID